MCQVRIAARTVALPSSAHFTLLFKPYIFLKITKHIQSIDIHDLTFKI
jgi:hypothetical protein